MSFMIFSGPCVLESEELALEIAQSLQEQLKPFGDKVKLTFKGSFDKANRTSINSYRGPGIEKGLKIMEAVKAKTGLPVITDFHLPEQAEEVASVCNVLQIPAFLCRQTDMIIAGAEACKKYNGTLKIKKGQFLSPEETKNIVEKAENFISKDQIPSYGKRYFFWV